MQYSKPMIELVYEIRRRVTSDLKPSVKLANPELFDELRNYYFGKADSITKALIKELFSLAGPEWAEALRPPTQPIPKQRVKVYRGQTILEPKKEEPMNEAQIQHMKKRIYRGRVVVS